jgi:hypothetical protein
MTVMMMIMTMMMTNKMMKSVRGSGVGWLVTAAAAVEVVAAAVATYPLTRVATATAGCTQVGRLVGQRAAEGTEQRNAGGALLVA